MKTKGMLPHCTSVILIALVCMGAAALCSAKTIETFSGSAQEDQQYEQKKTEAFGFAASGDVAGLRQSLDALFAASGDCPINVRIGMAKILPDIAGKVSPAQAAQIAQDASNWLNTCKQQVLSIEGQGTIDSATWKTLQALYPLRDALALAFQKTDYISSSGNPSQRLSKLLAVLNSTDLIPLETLLFALKELPNIITYDLYCQGAESQVNTALVHVQEARPDDEFISSSIVDTRQELERRWLEYAQGVTDDGNVDLSLLNHANQAIRHNAYMRLFKGSFGSRFDSAKLPFLQTSTKDKRFFADEIAENNVSLPVADIINLTPNGPYYSGTSITFQGRGIIADDIPAAELSFNWTVMDDHYAQIETFSGDTATVTFSQPGNYKVGFEASQGTYRSLTDIVDISILASKPDADKPLILMLEPTSVLTNELMLIEGKRFGDAQGGSKVFFADNAAATVSQWSDKRIICSVPINAQSGALRVDTVSGQSNEMFVEVRNAMPAPAAPTELAAPAASITSSSITLTWNDNSANETGFKIECSLDGSTWTQIMVTGANTAATASYQKTGLIASTTYFYRVRANNAAGDSAYTGPVSATTSAPPQAPPKPLLYAGGQTPSQLNIWWNCILTSQTGYKIERSLNGASGWTQINLVPADTYDAYGDLTVTPGSTYYYRVCATNATGDSAYSNKISRTAPTSGNWPTAPANLRTLAQTTTGITIGWDCGLAPAPAGFQIIISKTPAFPALVQDVSYKMVTNGASRAFTWSGLTPNTTYYFWVRGFGSGGMSGYLGRLKTKTS